MVVIWSPFFKLLRISSACFFRLLSGRIIKKYISASMRISGSSMEPMPTAPSAPV
jgi:hypothetical protein